MDYEKKYNEAMLRADEAVQKGCLDKDMFDIIFPPEEIEDERIRKFLFDYAIEMIAGLESDISLSTYNGIKGHDPDAEAELNQWQKARAYLEKQQQKPWSGEDENALKYLHGLISFGFAEKFFDAQTASDMRKWLNTRFKSIRPDTFQNGNSRPKTSDNLKPSEK